jgi:hypothetical protein
LQAFKKTSREEGQPSRRQTMMEAGFEEGKPSRRRAVNKENL